MDFQVLKATLVVVAIHFKIVRNFSPKTIIMSFTHKRQNVEKNNVNHSNIPVGTGTHQLPGAVWDICYFKIP